MNNFLQKEKAIYKLITVLQCDYYFYGINLEGENSFHSRNNNLALNYMRLFHLDCSAMDKNMIPSLQSICF